MVEKILRTSTWNNLLCLNGLRLYPENVSERPSTPDSLLIPVHLIRTKALNFNTNLKFAPSP